MDNSPKSNAPLRVSVTHASRLFGVSERTIRLAIKRKDISYVVVLNRYKINFDSLLEWSQKSTKIRNKRDRFGVGKFVSQWKMQNTKFSPNPKLAEPLKQTK